MSELSCSFMEYDWGKLGQDSMVYELLSKHNGKGLDVSRPYAELWMGDHDKAPSHLGSGTRMQDDERYGRIPYLFKVLSIHKPLSIQVHPNKDLAAKLHASNPANYPDGNEKPEMAVFITNTSLLYGIRPFPEIKGFLSNLKEFREVCSEQEAEKFIQKPCADTLKCLITKLFENSRETIRVYNERLCERFDRGEFSLPDDVVYAFRIIRKYFPGDVGLFFALILNVVTAGPGTAIFIPSGTLHAYLEGNLYEAMLVSDNAVRAGMTPKYIDVPSFLQAVNFDEQPPHYIHPQSDGQIVSFVPPIPEFCIKFASVEVGQSKTINLQTTGIALVESGEGTIEGTHVTKGTVLALQAGTINIFANTLMKVIICHSQE